MTGALYRTVLLNNPFFAVLIRISINNHVRLPISRFLLQFSRVQWTKHHWSSKKNVKKYFQAYRQAIGKLPLNIILTQGLEWIISQLRTENTKDA